MSTVPPIPDIITHYSRGQPFRSITSAAAADWPEIVAEMTEQNTWCRGRFGDPNYLSRRVGVERRLRDWFVSTGGQPRVRHPFYCMVGRGKDAGQRPGTRAYVVPLSAIPTDALSFTFGDSLVCLDGDNRAAWASLGHVFSEFCGRMSRFEQLGQLQADVRERGLPDRFTGPFHRHLEVQLWMAPPQRAIEVVEL